MCNEYPRCSRNVPNSEYCKATTNPLESWDSGSCRRFCQFVCNMAEATAEEKGKSIFLDVFRRADKNDDGALSWSEFTAFFSDGILSTEDLKKLFSDIDTHQTNNLDTSELCEFFLKEAGPFSQVFSGLEDMNTAVSNALMKSFKDYSTQTFINKFITRFFLKEILGQVVSLQHHIDVAVDKLDEVENENRPTVVQAEVPNFSTTGGRMKRKARNFSQQTSVDASAVKSILSQEVNRLAELITKLETKAKFNVVEEEEVDVTDDNMVVIVSRKFKVSEKCLSKFRANTKAYIGASSLQEGCLHLCIRSFTGTNSFILYEIWQSIDDLNRHFASETSKSFMHSNIENLQQPEEYNKMTVPASWWSGVSN